jgi:DNA invertase Pin-like site-specific DNA recombinase
MSSFRIAQSPAEFRHLSNKPSERGGGESALVMSPTGCMTNAHYAIGYVRVSTDEQTRSGLGLEAQCASVTAAAGRLGLTLRRIITDGGMSGSVPGVKRPALMEAVTALGRGDVFLVAKRDRLGRDAFEVAHIERRLIQPRGARVVSAAGEGTEDDSPTGKAMRGMVDVFAELERDVIKARTKAALKAKRERRERAGQIPFGFMLAVGSQSKLVPAPVEQRLMARVHELAALGYPLRQIAIDLNAHGWTTRRETPWRFQYIARLLKVSA